MRRRGWGRRAYSSESGVGAAVVMSSGVPRRHVGPRGPGTPACPSADLEHPALHALVPRMQGQAWHLRPGLP